MPQSEHVLIYNIKIKIDETTLLFKIIISNLQIKQLICDKVVRRD